MNEVILKELNSIVNDVIENDLVLTIDTRISDVEDWDSLAHLQIVMLLEEKYQVEFPIDLVAEVDSISELIDSIVEGKNNG